MENAPNSLSSDRPPPSAPGGGYLISGKPPANYLTSDPGNLFGQKIEKPEKVTLLGNFLFFSLITIMFPFRKGTPTGGTSFGRGTLFGEGALFGKGDLLYES